MVKADFARDYYADLELPPTADIADIKKQFRKLALKYHPDRNPGHEAEVNSRFLAIQSAHEVLIDPEQKAKYDAHRGRSSRYPVASGVKGNPWQNAASAFPVPPKRSASTRHSASSGASRYTNFAPGTPPTAKKNPADDQESRRSRWHAFESMRASSSTKTHHAQTQHNQEPEARDTKASAPRPVPQTPTQKQRADASFGNRKSNFYPRSPEKGDDPPTASRNYATSRHTSNMFNETAAKARRRRASSTTDPSNRFQGPFDTRQRTPYQTHGGEKLNPFEGIPLGRAKSTRERSEQRQRTARDDSPASQYRSSSVPRHGGPDGSPGLRVPHEDERPHTADEGSGYNGASFATRAGDQYSDPHAAHGSAFHNDQQSSKNAPETNHTANVNEEPSMYAVPGLSDFPTYSHFPTSTGKFKSTLPTALHCQCGCGSVSFAHEPGLSSHFSQPSPSGANMQTGSLNPYERQMHVLLSRLVRSSTGTWPPIEKANEGKKRKSSYSGPCNYLSGADKKIPNSFTFSVNDETFQPDAPSQSAFTRSSADDINTRFVNGESADTWQFNAGGSSTDATGKPRSQSSSRVGHRSSIKGPTIRRANEPFEQSAGSGTENGRFDAESWAGKLGPQNFVPSQTQASTGSPTRAARSNSRKSKTVRPTMGNAGMVHEDTTSSSDEGEWFGRQGFAGAASANSPNAMDIDTPPAEAAELKTPTPPDNGPRTIPVEPSRPEWRPGNVNGIHNTANRDPGRTKEFQANAVGSEDSEEFRASFADLKGVPPFASPGGGLGSFGDLKESLPFESKASAHITIDPSTSNSEIPFPKPPMAPRPPPALALSLKPSSKSWQKYVTDFQTYIRCWDEFDAKVSAHFTARAAQVADARRSKGFAFLGAVGDAGCTEYLGWIQQDNEIRGKWDIVSKEHEQRVKEFMAYRERMK